ncbi:MAG: hypothetical protein JNM36_03945 [Chitinophagales bacterium]|nr:hypothetical protein [Chitinophagales bacterium]
MGKTNDSQQITKNQTFFIDGTNLCYWHDTAQPSLNVLMELLIVLKREKGVTFYCIFDANTHYKLPPDQREIYQKLLEHKEYFYQITGGKKADDFILELADSYEAPVISNDNYNDPRYAKYRWKEREYVPKRLFMGEVMPVKGNIHLIITDLDIHLRVNNNSEHLFKQLLDYIQKPATKLRGKVKFFEPNAGWGLLVYENDLYFQRPPSLTFMEEGTELEFVIGNNERGPCAEQISLVPESQLKKYMVGCIESYDDSKLVGFIKTDSNETLFFYRSYLESGSPNALVKGMYVEYIPGQNRNGKCAKNIRIIPETDEVKRLRRKVMELESQVKVKDNTIQQLKKTKVEPITTPVSPSNNVVNNEKPPQAAESNLATETNQNQISVEGKEDKDKNQVLSNKNTDITPVKSAENLLETADKQDTPNTNKPADKNTAKSNDKPQQILQKFDHRHHKQPSPQQKKDLLKKNFQQHGNTQTPKSKVETEQNSVKEKLPETKEEQKNVPIVVADKAVSAENEPVVTTTTEPTPTAVEVTPTQEPITETPVPVEPQPQATTEKEVVVPIKEEKTPQDPIPAVTTNSKDTVRKVLPFKSRFVREMERQQRTKERDTHLLALTSLEVEKTPAAETTVAQSVEMVETTEKVLAAEENKAVSQKNTNDVQQNTVNKQQQQTQHLKHTQQHGGKQGHKQQVTADNAQQKQEQKQATPDNAQQKQEQKQATPDNTQQKQEQKQVTADNAQQKQEQKQITPDNTQQKQEQKQVTPDNTQQKQEQKQVTADNAQQKQGHKQQVTPDNAQQKSANPKGKPQQGKGQQKQVNAAKNVAVQTNLLGDMTKDEPKQETHQTDVAEKTLVNTLPPADQHKKNAKPKKGNISQALNHALSELDLEDSKVATVKENKSKENITTSTEVEVIPPTKSTETAVKKSVTPKSGKNVTPEPANTDTNKADATKEPKTTTDKTSATVNKKATTKTVAKTATSKTNKGNKNNEVPPTVVVEQATDSVQKAEIVTANTNNAEKKATPSKKGKTKAKGDNNKEQ